MTEKRVRTVTLINGRKVAPAAAKISVFDNSLLYAEGLFETLLAIDDSVIFFNEHIDRLYSGARVTGLKIPVNRKTLAHWMYRTVHSHPARMKKLRLTVTSGEAARFVGIQGSPQVILSASPHSLPERPFRLHVSDFRVDQQSIFRRIKTISYAIHAAALKQAKQRGADDALLLNENGQVAEVTSANIFWVRNGVIYTPPISAGCLEGITRNILLVEAMRLKLKVTEKDESLSRILSADEIFITSSLKLAAAVSQIVVDGKRHQFHTGDVTRLLSKRFRAMVGLGQDSTRHRRAARESGSCQPKRFLD